MRYASPQRRARTSHRRRATSASATRCCGNWIRKARQEGSGGISEDERTELARLRREVRRLKEEREILTKATAFFAKEGR